MFNLVGYLFNERTDINRSVLTIRRISYLYMEEKYTAITRCNVKRGYPLRTNWTGGNVAVEYSLISSKA